MGFGVTLERHDYVFVNLLSQLDFLLRSFLATERRSRNAINLNTCSLPIEYLFHSVTMECVEMQYRWLFNLVLEKGAFTMSHCWLGHGGPRLQPRRPKIPNLRWITRKRPVKSTATRHPKSEAVLKQGFDAEI